MTDLAIGQQWRARPHLATLLRSVLLCTPLLASMGSVWGLGRALPAGAARTWWGLAVLLSCALVVAVLAERLARRLLPVTLLLKLSMIFPDQAPSRLRVARTAVAGPPRTELLWHGAAARPTDTSDLVMRLIGSLTDHDRRTRGHSERVRVLCDMLARELKLDEAARDRLRWAALLHDVGKMGVAPAVLNKPGPLDGQEFDRIKEHPEAGAELAAPLLPWLGEWGDGILDHHERYDGTGYPHGKAGEEISLSGRLIGLVDAFETMTSARPYKKAMSHRAARAELVRCAGTHFDPVLVRAFLALSLPRVLWAMGPLSFLLQLPFLSPLAQAGLAGGSAVPPAAAAFAAGAAIAAGGAGMPAADLPSRDVRPPVTAAQQSASPSATATPAPTPSPAVAAASPAPVGSTRPVTVSGSAPPPRTTGSPESSPAPASGAQSSAAPSPTPGRVLLSGPASSTASRDAEFGLAAVAGRQWECQVPRSTAGGGWQPCRGTFAVTVPRDGDYVLRVRDVDSRDVVDSWSWTVDSAEQPRRTEPTDAATGP